MARWKPFAAAMAVVLLAAAPGVLAQTATRPKPPARNTTAFPELVRTNFMSSCTQGGKVTEALCGCVYRNIEREMTLDEFMEFDRKAQADPDTPPPQQMRDIAMACVQDNGY
jgi:hypothetical protein